MKSMDLLKKGCVLLGILAFLVLFSSIVNAKTIHSAWHYSGDTFTVEGDVYLITHFDFYDTSVLLEVNNVSYVIVEGACKTTPTRKYCVDEIFKDREGAEKGDPIKFEGGTVYAGIKFTVLSHGPSVSVSRSFSTTNSELNEEVTVTVTVKNSGTETAKAFTFTDGVPEGVFITASSSDVESTSSSVFFTATLLPDEEETFTYKFKITDYIDFVTKPNASYIYNGVKNEVKVGGTTIKVIKPYEFKPTLSPNNFEVTTKQAALNIRIDNKVSDDITVEELFIEIPDLLSVPTSPKDLEIVDDKYFWQGLIEPEKYKILNLLLAPAKAGTYKIPINIKIRDFENKNFSEQTNITLTAKVSQLVPILSVKDKSVSEGSTFRVAFSVKNPNEKVGFRDITASIKSELFTDLDVELSELIPGKTQTLIVNDTLRVPFLDQEKTFEIEVTGSYETTTYENFNFSKKDSIKVTPIAEAISIEQSVDKTEVVAGTNVTVTVKIRNNNEEAINVNVSDKYHEDLILLGGDSEDLIYFTKSGVIQAYTYKLHVPLTFESQEFEITTTAIIEGKDYFDDKTTTVKVTFPEPKEEEEEEEEETQPEQEQQPQPKQEAEKKPGFFRVIINAIGNFFKRIFGGG
ncbi:hypothetical protein AYK26_00510 [Euryarchaeota archaeon SM23-78]|nr:MAG: hypothetical protein AYK26_00510 [Euryarchaeota archaeon SM23-78]MBW3001240.1 DUF11 domain-containing protein [Candidatus Woesearchaeota archaeon]